MTTSLNRLVSLDAFRGFTIAAMFLVNNPGDWGHVYAPLLHAPWSGWTFTDCIFPFFLFIVGVSLHFSLANNQAQNYGKGQTLRLLCRRAGIIFVLGLLLNFIPQFDISSVRIPGVLQRIAICSLFAGVLLIYCSWRQISCVVLGILLAYTCAMLFIPVPDAQGNWIAGNLQPGQDLAAWIDRYLLEGHLWKKSKTWDPEGVLSSLPATASVLIGALFGRLLDKLRHRSAARQHQMGVLVLAGAVCLGLGILIDAFIMPINKSLWSSSYCLLMSGIAIFVYSMFYWGLDASSNPALKHLCATISLPLVMFGRNALFLFVLASLLAKLMNLITVRGVDNTSLSLQKSLFLNLAQLPISPINASLLFAILFCLVMFAIAHQMWRCQWFVKV